MHKKQIELNEAFSQQNTANEREKDNFRAFVSAQNTIQKLKQEIAAANENLQRLQPPEAPQPFVNRFPEVNPEAMHQIQELQKELANVKAQISSSHPINVMPNLPSVTR